MSQYDSKISGVQPNHPIRRREGWACRALSQPKSVKMGGGDGMGSVTLYGGAGGQQRGRQGQVHPYSFHIQGQAHG
jgi:hypothetical protein